MDYFWASYVGRCYPKSFVKDDSWALSDRMLKPGSGERLFALAFKN
tara:strand:- start:254 stop:391 length:138 start_codon:yes stop_codon:yes gene_type:complete